MLSRIDLWIGKRLFLPLIMKLCHLLRQSQYAIARLFWFAAMLSGLYRAEHVIEYLVFGHSSLIMMLTASLRADRPTRSQLWFRIFAIAALAARLATVAAGGSMVGIEFWIFVLIAEYAMTIQTLPPRNIEKTTAHSVQAET